MQGIIAFDPGKGGGLAQLSPGSTDEDILLRRWTVEHEFTDHLRTVNPAGYVAVVEDVPVHVSTATSNSSSFKLGYNFGYIIGSLRSMGFKTHLVKPREWQKGLSGLRPKMGYTDRKRCLKDNAARLYPTLKITHATADALLILDWYRKNCSGW